MYNKRMQHNTVFKLVYTFILGVTIAVFFGIGISAFYEEPRAPEYPGMTADYKMSQPTEAELAKQREIQRQFDTKQKAYESTRKEYNRNVSVILLALAVLAVVVAFVAAPKVTFLSDGILLGGLFTLLYSIVRGLSADDNKFLFVIATVSVVVVLFLGYRRFLAVPSAKKK